MPDILIKNTRIYYNNALQPAEIVIEGGKVTKIGKDLRISSSDLIIDAGGALTLPAGIDVHVHFREPGMTSKENWYTGSCAAAAGGITTVIDQPNTIPPTTDRRSFEQKHKLARGKSIIDFGINGGVTDDIEKLKELWKLGVTAFGEIFMAESTGGLNVNEETFEEALVEIKRLGALATIHAEDEKMRLELEDATSRMPPRKRMNPRPLTKTKTRKPERYFSLPLFTPPPRWLQCLDLVPLS